MSITMGTNHTRNIHIYHIHRSPLVGDVGLYKIKVRENSAQVTNRNREHW